MSKTASHATTAPETGPVYGVELLDSLPLGNGGMSQACPSRTDLMRIAQSDLVGSTRVVAGYEIVVDHFRELASALRELHDFAEPSTDLDYGDRSRHAFERAARLLERVES